MSLDTRLHELFEGQERAIDVAPREWDGVPLATVTTLEEQRRRPTRTIVGAGIAIVASAAAITVAATYGNSAAQVRSHPPIAGAPSGPGVNTAGKVGITQINTHDVHIVLNGKPLSAPNARVSSPNVNGNDLELTWWDAGARARVSVAFSWNAHDWQVTRVRSQDGNNDWITYTGPFTRTSLGQSVSLNLTDAGRGSALQFSGLIIGGRH